MKAIRVQSPGGPEVLKYEEVSEPKPGPGQALVKLHAIGVNFIDVYHRTGLYKLPLPFTPGMEGAGVVESVGEGVTEVQLGDRVAYAMAVGAYAELAAVPSWQLVKLPANNGFLKRCGSDAARHDRSLFDPQHVCHSAWGHDIGARGGWWRGAAHCADGQAARRPGDWHRLHRREGTPGTQCRR